MTEHVVSSGVTSSGLTLSGRRAPYVSDSLRVLSGGTADNATVLTSAFIEVDAGGLSSRTAVSSDGRETVFFDGTAIGTTLDGGNQYVLGTATSTTVNTGGIEFVSSGGTAVDTSVNSGGYLLVLPGATETGATVQPGGAVVSSGVALLNSTGLPFFGPPLTLPTQWRAISTSRPL